MFERELAELWRTDRTGYHALRARLFQIECEGYSESPLEFSKAETVMSSFGRNPSEYEYLLELRLGCHLTLGKFGKKWRARVLDYVPVDQYRHLPERTLAYTGDSPRLALTAFLQAHGMDLPGGFVLLPHTDIQYPEHSSPKKRKRKRSIW